jgi:hypothetical protein
MIIGGIDPSGTTGHGLAVWCTDRGLLWWGQAWPAGTLLDFAVVEGPWSRQNKMGKLQMWGLGFDASWRLCEAPAARKFVQRPDEWRAEWGWVGKAKPVIINRLRRDLDIVPTDAAIDTIRRGTDDEVEAAGIAGAWARRLARAGTKGLRRGCEVKR